MVGLEGLEDSGWCWDVLGSGAPRGCVPRLLGAGPVGEPRAAWKCPRRPSREAGSLGLLPCCLRASASLPLLLSPGRDGCGQRHGHLRLLGSLDPACGACAQLHRGCSLGQGREAGLWGPLRAPRVGGCARPAWACGAEGRRGPQSVLVPSRPSPSPQWARDPTEPVKGCWAISPCTLRLGAGPGTCPSLGVLWSDDPNRLRFD